MLTDRGREKGRRIWSQLARKGKDFRESGSSTMGDVYHQIKV